jgi:recombination protein RecT
VAEKKNELQVTFSEMLTDKLVAVQDALPKDFNRQRFVQNAVAVMNEKPELAKCNKAMLAQCLMKGAYLGLDFMNKECYIVQYGNTLNFQTSYIGEIKFVKKYSKRKIKDIYAKIVREGDEYEEMIVDGHQSVSFKPIPFNNKPILGAFAVVLYEDGGMDVVSMTTEEINNTRANYSKASNSKAWKNSWEEMAKKTSIRRLCKLISTDFESVEAGKAWEEGSGMTFTNNKPEPGEVVDVFQQPDIEVESTVIESEEESVTEE